MSASVFSELTVRQLLAHRRRLAGGLSDPERTLRGVLLAEGRRCSSEGCRCRRGELHGPYSYLAVYVDGRTRTVYVPQAVAPVAEAHVGLTQRNEDLLAEISQINLELLRRRALE
ncbi:MAG: DUF6788 family protein [Solirubrobacteraceae bacterium]